MDRHDIGNASKKAVFEQSDTQYSGQTYLSGNIPTELSAGKLEESNEERKILKMLKEIGATATAYYGESKPEIRSRMNAADAFERSR